MAKLELFSRLLPVLAMGGASALTLAYWWLLRPPHHPRNIPAVPFWVVLLPFIYDVDQEETYRNYIEGPLHKFGAVKIFFGGQWNLLVQRPSLLSEVFKDEETYQKSGNQKKIPHTVLAEFLGDNIISSRGAEWKLYQDIVKPGLQRNFEIETVLSHAEDLCLLIHDAQQWSGGNGVPVQGLVQRYTIANALACLLQTNVKTLHTEDEPINELQSAMKREIFKPIFMNFPVLDRLGSWIPSRVLARQLVEQFSKVLQARLLQSHDVEACSLSSQKLGARLVAARRNDLLTEKQFRDNLNVTFVAGQENPQLLMISVLYLLGKHPDVQSRLRSELQDADPTTLQDISYLTAVIFESLRLLPPISQLINRRVSRPTTLGPMYIPKGMYVGYNCYSTNRDPQAWGPTADEFRPDRWGSTSPDIFKCYRRARAKAEFISFHGGKRACLGEKFALLQLRVTLFVLVRRYQWTLPSTWPDRKTPAGPLYPRALRLLFTECDPARTF